MKRGKFSLSNYKLFTCDMGELVPMGVMEVLPGDSIQQATSALVRTSPLLAPVMHPVTVRIHHWFVPFRLLWDQWEDFITAGPTGTSLPTFPTITLPNPTTVGSLADYLGIPNALNAPVVSALPFRAYAKIFNENYRDQDLVTELTETMGSGNDIITNTALKNVAWEKDYFTSARPWEQKGPQVTIPLGNQAIVKTNPTALVTGAQSASTWKTQTGTTPANSTALNFQTGQITTSALGTSTPGPGHYPDNLYADLSSASAITVNALRQALALQSFEEARARYGSRYVEYLRYLGVKSSDARLQRPEYLGGGKQTIQFSEVLATAASTTPATTVGEMKGHGISAMRSNRYRRYFEEHGMVLSLISTLPKTMYVQGIARHWNRRTKEEFWQREFEHLGQQAVKNKEVYAAAAAPEATFGYQDRYDEYRRTENTIAGEFRTTALDYWHMGRVFASEPALNSSFVTSTPSKRNFASASTDALYVMAKHNIQARRLLAQTGTSFIR
jgi:hypothetical protein